MDIQETNKYILDRLSLTETQRREVDSLLLSLGVVDLKQFAVITNSGGVFTTHFKPSATKCTAKEFICLTTSKTLRDTTNSTT